MIMLLILLLIYGIFIFGFIVALQKIRATKRSAVFAGFALFGILSGLVAALYGHHEGQYIYNIPGTLLGDAVYGLSIKFIGDPHSAFAHYTIPWFLRTPEVVLFTSAIVWSLLGLLAQLVYNGVKKPLPVTKGISTLVIVALLIACLGVSAGIVYRTQDERERHGPTQPSAFPVREASTSAPPDWETITTWEIESLSLTPWGLEDLSLPSVVIKTGEELLATGVVKNTGSKKGIAEIELEVDGKVLSSQEVALLSRESKPVKFGILVPRPGVYTVRMGDLTNSFEALEAD